MKKITKDLIRPLMILLFMCSACTMTETDVSTLEVRPTTLTTPTSEVSSTPTLETLSTSTVVPTATLPPPTSLSETVDDNILQDDPTSTKNIPSGKLVFMSNEDELVYYDFSTETIMPLPLPQQEHNILEDITFAENDLAYFIELDNKAEIWLFSFEDWSARLLVTLPKPSDLLPKYKYTTIERLLGDRYLAIRFIAEDHLDTTGIDEDMKVYIIDKLDGSIISESEIEPNQTCQLLAISSNTGRLATWCQFTPEDSFLVIESNGDIWVTTSPPEEIISLQQYGGYGWDWSLDQDWVAFLQPSSSIPRVDRLRLFNSPSQKTKQLSDNVSNYALLDLSPYATYIAYTGECKSGSFICSKVINTVNNEVVWTTDDLPEQQGYIVGWSPDENFLVVTYQSKLYVVDFLTNSIVATLDGDSVSSWVLE